jgi:hypothetical protein
VSVAPSSQNATSYLGAYPGSAATDDNLSSFWIYPNNIVSKLNIAYSESHDFKAIYLKNGSSSWGGAYIAKTVQVYGTNNIDDYNDKTVTYANGGTEATYNINPHGSDINDMQLLADIEFPDYDDSYAPYGYA